MKNKSLFIFVLISVMLTMVACSKSTTWVDTSKTPEKLGGQIYLYGEYVSVK